VVNNTGDYDVPTNGHKKVRKRKEASKNMKKTNGAR
jgi:hypothetical protein